MPRGGKREGAGRKPGVASILAEKTRAFIAEEINKNIKPIVEAQIKKAKSGDTVAFRELLDRGFGKARESLDMTTGGEKIVFVPSELMKKHAINTGTIEDSE